VTCPAHRLGRLVGHVAGFGLGLTQLRQHVGGQRFGIRSGMTSSVVVSASVSRRHHYLDRQS
jgi:hypothetical protein